MAKLLARSYVERLEIEGILRAALGSKKPLVVLKGATGSGKTTLLNRVVESWRDEFSAGVVRIQARGESTTPEVSNWLQILSGRGGRGLLIVEDGASSDIEWLATSIRAEPGIKAVLEVRTGIPSTLMGETFTHLNRVPTDYVTVPQFSFGEFETFARRVFPNAADPMLLKTLYAQSYGNMAILDEIAAANDKARGGLLSNLRELMEPIDRPTLLGPDGKPIDATSPLIKPLIADVCAIDDRLISILADRPALMHELHPRKFEELVAELIARQGYEVELTPYTRDGGKDIYAVRKDGLGRFLLLVECKRYASNEAVGIGVIQRLAGVVYGSRANGGIVATTSYFSKEARECQDRDYQSLISLRDYIHLHEWLNAAKR